MVADPPERPETTMRFDPQNVWRVGFVVMGLVAVALGIHFVISDGGSVVFTLLMAWFAALAMEPAVGRLSRHMPRGVATALVMLGLAGVAIVFMLAFGQLFIDQIAQLLKALPGVVDSLVGWVNAQFNTQYSADDILGQLQIEPSQVAQYAGQIAGGVLGILGSVVGGVFSIFTLALFAFYFAADGPRFRLWIASLFPQRAQSAAVSVWDVTADKVGAYVAARVVLAFINGSTSALVFWLIGMPSWLALGIWTGVVAQFVPTIGTYIAIALPVIVGLLSPTPWIGVAALVWAVAYQQVENLTIEPKISARAVDVHPAVAFASVMLGAALFGIAGALLAIPVSAMLIAVGGLRHKRHDLAPGLANES